MAVGYRLLARVEQDEGKVAEAERGLGRYKEQTRTVERGFWFLKDPLGSTFLKRPERVMALGMVMALALLVYALAEWTLRQRLGEGGEGVPNQKGKPTTKPTLRWVFQLFLWIRLVSLGGQVVVLNLKSHHERVVRLLGVGRYYQLE